MLQFLLFEIACFGSFGRIAEAAGSHAREVLRSIEGNVLQVARLSTELRNSFRKRTSRSKPDDGVEAARAAKAAREREKRAGMSDLEK